jgi:HEAT repeat protein
MTAKLDKAHAVYAQLTEDHLRLERRVAALESENQLLRIDVKKLNERIDALGAGGAKGVPPPLSADLADVGMKIDQALAKLKTTGNVDEAARDLVPLSRYSVTKMTDTLKQFGSPEYSSSIEKVLAKCPPAELKGPLEEAVKDRRRTSVARVVGAVRDPGLSKILEPYTGDSDPIVQVELGQALLDCKNRMGIPPLLNALKAGESEIRFRAILSLKRLNRGETFGFDMNKTADENSAAIKAWHEWWQKDGQKVFE